MKCHLLSRRMSGTRAAALGACLVAGLLVGSPASATPASGFTAVQQWKGVYPPVSLNTQSDRRSDKDDKWDVKLMTKDMSDIYVTRNAIAVGGQSGWHSHPGPSLITVTSGTLTVYEASDPTCTPIIYTAGQSFTDIGCGDVHLIRNEGSVNAVTVVVQIVPAGQPRRVDEPAPGNCPVITCP